MPKARSSIGAGALPDGDARYRSRIREQTTTDMEPSAIHEMGLKEVVRLNFLLEDVARQAGYSDLKTYRAALRIDPNLIPTSAQAIVDDFRRYVTRMRPKLPLLFDAVPSTELVVEAMPDGERPNITHHIDGSEDGLVPGRILIATADFASRKLTSDETFVYHEGIPGHELQVSIQQRLKGLPDFRKSYRNSAYEEGWAVYAEALGKEAGFFEYPASDYGRLNTELLRALRLVVDTGVHAYVWSREQAIQYMRQSEAIDEPTIQSEIDRVIAWPAQGLSYKIGQLKILELRSKAQTAFGNDFDI